MSSSTTDPGERSSAQIEREVENTRANLTDTLDTLRDRVSPGHLMDQAVEYLRGSGGREFANNLGRTVRDNPIPVLLIGAGMGWLMMSGGRSAETGHARPQQALPSPGTTYLPTPTGGPAGARSLDTHNSATHASPTRASGMAHDDGHEKESLTERASAAASGVAGRVSDTASHAYDRVAGAAGSAAEGVGAAAGNVSHRATELAHDARDYAARAGSSAQHGMNWLLHEQPMVLGGIGLAIGAAIGAMLPTTRTENRLMGEASDKITGQVKDAAQEGYERAQEVAGDTLERAKATAAETYDTAKDRLDESGLSPSKVGDALGAVVHDVADAAKKGLHDAAGGVRGAMEEAAETKDPGTTQEAGTTQDPRTMKDIGQPPRSPRI